MSFYTHDPDIHTLTHDSSNALGLLTYYMNSISSWLKDNVKQIHDVGINTSLPFVQIERMKAKKKECMDSIDYYYSKEKAKYEQKVKDGIINAS